MTTAEKRVWARSTIAMAIVLAASNYLVRFPLNDFLTLAAFTYPAAFLITDYTNRAAGAKTARRVVYAGFVFGVPLSFIFIYAAPPDDGGGLILARALPHLRGRRFCVRSYWMWRFLTGCAGRFGGVRLCFRHYRHRRRILYCFLLWLLSAPALSGTLWHWAILPPKFLWFWHSCRFIVY